MHPPTLIVVTRRILIPATHLTPAHYVCTYRNTFKGEAMPLSKGTTVLFWGAIPEQKKLLKGEIGGVVCHERHWVEVRIKPTGAPRLEPSYHIRLPLSAIRFNTRTIFYRFILHFLLDNRHTKFPHVTLLPARFGHMLVKACIVSELKSARKTTTGTDTGPLAQGTQAQTFKVV